MIPFLAALGGALAGLAVAALAFRAALRRQARLDRDAARRDRDEEQAALMGTIASGLAHEIRNPLSTVSMNLQLLREDWEAAVTEKEQRCLRKVDTLLKEVRRLETILNDFLKFAAGHKLRLERVDLNALLEELLDFAEPQAARARIRLERRLATGRLAVQADANLLRQVFLNLMLNAFQAMPEGGELEVRTEPTPDGPRVVLRDSGIGIPPENLDKIFTLYFSTKPSGTGLGLPMARKIVEEHRGSIAVASEPGRGTTFTVSLPALDAGPLPAEDGSP